MRTEGYKSQVSAHRGDDTLEEALHRSSSWCVLAEDVKLFLGFAFLFKIFSEHCISTSKEYPRISGYCVTLNNSIESFKAILSASVLAKSDKLTSWWILCPLIYVIQNIF